MRQWVGLFIGLLLSTAILIVFVFTPTWLPWPDSASERQAKITSVVTQAQAAAAAARAVANAEHARRTALNDSLKHAQARVDTLQGQVSTLAVREAEAQRAVDSTRHAARQDSAAMLHASDTLVALLRAHIAVQDSQLTTLTQVNGVLLAAADSTAHAIDSLMAVNAVLSRDITRLVAVQGCRIPVPLTQGVPCPTRRQALLAGLLMGATAVVVVRR